MYGASIKRFTIGTMNLLLVVLLCHFTSRAFAEEYRESARRSDRSSMMHGFFSQPNSRTARLDFAKWLLAEVENLRLALKALTPDEIAWIQSEEKQCAQGGGSDRCARYLQTETYRLSQLHHEISNAVSNLQCVTNSRDTRSEMACWAAVSWTLNDHRYEDNALVASKNDWFARGIANEDGTAILLPLYANGVLQAFVIPYLQGRIGDDSYNTKPGAMQRPPPNRPAEAVGPRTGRSGGGLGGPQLSAWSVSAKLSPRS